MSNSSKGASSLASVIQRRMAQVAKSGADIGVTVEFGEIVQGDKLKLYSVPGAILDRSDYSVCECVTIRNEYYEVKPIVTAEGEATCSNGECNVSVDIETKVKLPPHPERQLQTGDKVLIVWTFDGEPVVIDKIV